jgi:hypothetical protein
MEGTVRWGFSTWAGGGELGRFGVGGLHVSSPSFWVGRGRTGMDGDGSVGLCEKYFGVVPVHVPVHVDNSSSRGDVVPVHPRPSPSSSRGRGRTY